MRRKSIGLFLASAMMLLTLLTGCGGNDAAKDSNQPANDGQPSSSNEAKDKDNITLRLDANVSTMDPNYSATTTNGHVMAQIYDTLYFTYQDHTVEPRLAESYEISDDNLTYTFKLRKGVKFHNGEEFKASDVVFTINKALDSAWLFSTVEQIESAEAADDYTVNIHLKNVYAPFLETISLMYMLNEKAVTEAGDAYGSSPVGTGPYKFVSYENASILKLTRFDDYFRGPASIKDITFNVIPDINTATIALETGETDFGGFSSASYNEIKNTSNLVIEETTSGHLMFIMMNVEQAPFDNKLIRQAVNYAVDREFMVDASAGGLADYSSTFLNPNVLGYSDKVKQYTYDTEKAKELLKEAGIQAPITIDSIKTIDGSFKKVAEILQSSLSDIGIVTDIELLEQNKYVEDAMSGNYGIGVMGSEIGIDADSFSTFFTPENIDGGNNMARYNNEEVSNLFAECRKTLDMNKRLEIYEKCFNIIEEDSPYVSLYNKKAMVAHDKSLKVDRIYPIYNQVYEMSWQ